MGLKAQINLGAAAPLLLLTLTCEMLQGYVFARLHMLNA